jgi:multidrug efflux pump subunit AcrA (membrane-fusion protein)
VSRLRTRRSRAIVSILAAALLVAGGVAAFAADDGPSGGGDRPLIITAEVQRRTLTDDVTLKGTVGRVEQRQVDATAPGHISAVHVDDGATVEAGQAILSIDGRDAVAAPGDFPFFRELDVGSQGNDVRQLEQILSEAGFSPGPVDSLYTDQTRAALAGWQSAHGYPGGTAERDETVTVALGQGTGYTLGDETAGAVVIGTRALTSAPRSKLSIITDGMPRISVQAMNAEVAEGAPAQFRISTDRDHDEVDLDVTVGGTAGVDDIVPPTVPVKFARNARSMVVDVPTRQDDRVEPDETIVFTLEPNTNVAVDSTAAVTSIVSDDVPELQIAGGGGVTEGARSVLLVTADQPPMRDTQITLTPGGDAVAGTDYQKLAPFVVLRAGNDRVEVPVVTLADDVIEDAERVVVSLASSSAGTYRIGREASAVVTIDRAVGAAAMPTLTLRASATNVPEGKPVPLSLSLSRAITDDLTIELAYAGDAVSGADYNPAPGRIVVPAGMTSFDIAVPTVDDDIVERDHTLTMSLAPSALFHRASQSAVTAVIESDDVPELRLAGGVDRVREGGVQGFTIVADQAPVEAISVAYQVLGSATPGQDFDALPGIAILPAGATEVTVALRTVADDVSFRPTDIIVGQWPTRIGQVLVDEGQSVAAGAPLLSLTDAGLTVTLRASATDRTKLQPGQKATVKLQDSSDSVEGTISQLDETASVDEQTKEQYYEGKIDVGDLPAADGAIVTIEVVLDQRTDALTVPIAAVKQDGDGNDVVRVIDLADNGEVTEMKVTTGISEGSYIEVREGLQGGEVVIVQIDNAG